MAGIYADKSGRVVLKLQIGELQIVLLQIGKLQIVLLQSG